MISAEHRAIVKATVPLLETSGEALTTRFYSILLDEHPSVRPYFNQANQHSGDQQRALANGLLQYARHIDELDELGDLVAQIISKHVSLQILPEHYPLVGASLLRAIREVLGEDVATDSVIDAWNAAYVQLANILMEAEGGIYTEVAAQPGGWRGLRRFTVTAKVPESSEITSFWFEPADGGRVVKHQPGQYIGIRLLIDDVDTRRNYSLSAAADGKQLRISVKRHPDGVMSRYLHDHLEPGDSVELTPPSGQFTLNDSDKPLVLITGGVGITPTLPMVTAALASQRPIYFIHSARRASAHAFRGWVDDLASKHPRLKRFYCYETNDGAAIKPDAVGYISAKLLSAWMPAVRDVDVYFLGPKPFMRAVKGHIHDLGVPDAQVHYEFFGPASALE